MIISKILLKNMLYKKKVKLVKFMISIYRKIHYQKIYYKTNIILVKTIKMNLLKYVNHF